MKLTQVPSIKVGTPYQRPSWRYDALSNPQKYGLVDFCSDIQPNAGCFKRLITKGIKPMSTYRVPEYFRKLSADLPSHLNAQLEKVWNKNYHKSNRRKISFNILDEDKIPLSWNIGKVLKLDDLYLKRLILHTFNYEHSDDIEYALRFYLSEENGEVKRYFGYAFYAGISDIDISKRWRIPLGKTRAIRSLFFDFSHYPKDRIASWVLLRQQAQSGEIEVEDYERYKKIYDLGELGLRMMVDYHGLSYDEKLQVENFLGSTVVSNTINLNLSIRTSRDALNYSGAIASFARLSLYKEELRQKEATIRLTELQIKKGTKELNLVENTTYDEDETLLIAMKEMAKHDSTPTFAGTLDLQKLK